MHTPWKVHLRQLISRPALQGFWLSVLKLACAGMNYGGGQIVDDSGEQEALLFAAHAMPAHSEADPFILFDVGANRGSYLDAALHLLGPGVRAYSFEPQPFNIGLLRQRFGEDSRVTLVEAALGSHIRTAPIYFSVEGEPTASLHTSPDAKSSHTVQVMTIDQFCRDRSLASIDMLKIDAEGHEMEVLLGARSMMEGGRIHSLQFEFGETFLQTPYHFRDLYDLLAPRYRIHRILRRGLAELPAYTPDLEVYKLANFLCIRKAPL